jgi:uncharacterized protein (TIGR02145 family)
MKKYLLILSVVLVATVSFNKKGIESSTSVNTNKIIDVDGNGYDTVTIGTQTWMVQNLQTTHYRNGNPIPNVSERPDWNNLSTGAYCDYNNDAANAKTNGHLYNWYAVNNPAGLCPTGWHIATDAEWAVLINYLGRDSVAGGVMKALGTTIWKAPNSWATNSSGFTALPSGYRHADGAFYKIGENGYFWSSTETFSYSACGRYLSFNTPGIDRFVANKQSGFSCRCIKD